MKRIANVSVVVILCVLSVLMLEQCAISETSSVNEDRKTIVVEIDYGDVRPARTVEAPWVKGRTALEVLQTVARVETYPVGQYVFVVSIDEVCGKRGEMGWYYAIDGKSADKLAFSNVLNDADCIRWIYKEDTCSGKVDK